MDKTPSNPVRRRILHLDMDAFFASVEVLDDPSLRGRPVIIAGSDRGVVSAASYEARRYGVHSAMPAARARKLCPHGVFLPGRMQRYKELSRLAMGVLREASPLVEQTSVDEAYVDITGTERIYGSSRETAAALKRSIFEATGGLTCSVGVAPNRFLAKICSDLDKPDGIYVLDPEDVPSFLRTLDVGKIPGVGPRLQKTLHTLGVYKAAEALRFSKEFWIERLGEKGGRFICNRARGIDHSPIVPRHDPKSTGAENTFSRDVDDLDEVKRWIARQSERVGRDLRKNGLYARTVTLKVKAADFSVQSKSLSLPDPVNTTDHIYRAALELFDAMVLPEKMRLVGVTASGLTRSGGQLGLFAGDERSRCEELDRTIDAIAERFGDKVISRGRTFGFKPQKD